MSTELAEDVATLRAFNRIYTTRLGLLDAHYDGSPFTLSEARILYELAHGDRLTGAEIARTLGLDPAQVSRTVKRFTERGLAAARENPAHGRHQWLSLTDEGRAAFAALEAATRARVGGLVEALSTFQRARLLSAASAINAVFAGGETPPTLRGLRPGDLGLVTARQAVLYAEEYGWNREYEALVARILADFHEAFDPVRDDAWIAEAGGRMVGSIFLVHGDEPGVAKLRLLYVEPDARGMGVGQRLVSTCIARARELGYARLDLWTNSVLTAARALYQRAGFTLVQEAPHQMFGHDLVSQTWSLDLRP
jgi:DNA-binding MarR family transcriptional regulator